MKFGVILGTPIITRQENGKYLVIHADSLNNWKITKYEDLTYDEALELPFVNELALALVK